METAPVISSSFVDRLFDYLKFENTASLIAILSGLSIVLSVAIIFGYFSVFDSRLIFFLSLQDVISNALTFTPILIPSIVIAFVTIDVVRFKTMGKQKWEDSDKRTLITIACMIAIFVISTVFFFLTGLQFTALFGMSVAASVVVHLTEVPVGY
ncbi:MAG: hypothetical protein Q7T14_14980, partial [Aestuariivirga sp.]|nr:hypothetical protein [Aestuariivirga sp.]